jgi:hypothetical protein
MTKLVYSMTSERSRGGGRSNRLIAMRWILLEEHPLKKKKKKIQALKLNRETVIALHLGHPRG